MSKNPISPSERTFITIGLVMVLLGIVAMSIEKFHDLTLMKELVRQSERSERNGYRWALLRYKYNWRLVSTKEGATQTAERAKHLEKIEQAMGIKDKDLGRIE